MNRELKIDRDIGQNPIRAMARDSQRSRRDWDTLIANESHLIPFVMLQQRTMRLAGIIPLWQDFVYFEYGWRVLKEIDHVQQRKLRAWWEMIFDVQRHMDDRPSVELALAYVVQEQLRRRHGQQRPVDPSFYRISAEHAQKVQIAVLSRFENLIPHEVSAEALARVRPT